MDKRRELAKYSVAETLGGLELLDARYEKQNFSRHSHEGYTVGVIETGAQRFFRTGSNHVAPQDSIILVNADEVHNGQAATDGGWSYKAMYPLPSQLDSISRDMGLNGAPYFPEAVVHDPELARQLRLVFGQLDVCENRLTRESLVYHFLSQLITRHGKNRREPGQLSGALRRLELVKEFLDDYPQADVSLEELARMAMLSPYHLVRSFSKAFGLPPHAYQIQSRLRVAKKLLRQGYNVSHVAQETGFHDQSHLHRHFKKALGVTPGQFASLQ